MPARKIVKEKRKKLLAQDVRQLRRWGSNAKTSLLKSSARSINKLSLLKKFRADYEEKMFKLLEELKKKNPNINEEKLIDYIEKKAVEESNRADSIIQPPRRFRKRKTKK